jgi:hypothetical protein
LLNLNLKLMNLKPKIREVHPIPVVYIHCIGDYNDVGPAWEKLIADLRCHLTRLAPRQRPGAARRPTVGILSERSRWDQARKA